MNVTNRKLLPAAFTLLVLLVAACSGERGNGGVPSGGTTGQPQKSTAKVRVSILIPKRPAVARRGRKYVSSETQSAEIDVNGTSAIMFGTTAGSPNCVMTEGGSSCSADVSAPLGPDTFTLNLYEGPLTRAGAVSGALLSSGTAGQTIKAGIANIVNVTLDGVVASLSVYFDYYPNNSVPAGTATAVPIYVNAYDAAENFIMSPGGYIDANGNPLTITVSETDAASTTTLSGTTSLTDPTQSTTLNYNGTPPHGTLPIVSASANGIPSASASFAITPAMKLVSPAFSAAPVAMTIGNDNKAYLLEAHASNTMFDPTIARVTLDAAGYGITTETSYVPASCPNGVSALAPAIAKDPAASGGVYITDVPACAQTIGAELVSVSSAGAFSPAPLQDSQGVVGASSALAFPSAGTAQLVADVSQPPTAVQPRLRQAVAPPSSYPSQSPSAMPSYSPYGRSIVTTTTAGAANSYTLPAALQLSTTDAYTFSGVPNANVITVDASGNTWFPQTITDTTTNTTQNVVIKANASGATAYMTPAGSGGTEQIVALTYASDGNVWYVANKPVTGGVEVDVGKISPGGTFSETVDSDNYPAVPVSTAIVEGADKALYTVVDGGILRIAESDGTFNTYSTTVATQFAAGAKTTGNDVYFAGPQLYELLY